MKKTNLKFTVGLLLFFCTQNIGAMKSSVYFLHNGVRKKIEITDDRYNINMSKVMKTAALAGAIGGGFGAIAGGVLGGGIGITLSGSIVLLFETQAVASAVIGGISVGGFVGAAAGVGRAMETEAHDPIPIKSKKASLRHLVLHWEDQVQVYDISDQDSKKWKMVTTYKGNFKSVSLSSKHLALRSAQCSVCGCEHDNQVQIHDISNQDHKKWKMVAAGKTPKAALNQYRRNKKLE